MASRRILKSVLHNFLGTFSSRHSDFQGYCLFGFLIETISCLEIDLLQSFHELDGNDPFASTRKIATTKFAEQLAKAQLPISVVKTAKLVMTKSPEPKSSYVGLGGPVNLFPLMMVVRVQTDLGTFYLKSKSIDVAQHDTSRFLKRFDKI